MSRTDSIAFAWDIKAATPVALDDGQLLIRGWALNYNIDREDEAFSETGALLRGIKAFIASNAPLCHHHDYKTVLGRVVSATPVAGKGIEVEAVVDFQPESSPWRHLYEAIKRGRLSNLSFGGLFRRQMTPDGPRIVDADFLELSVCGTSVGRGTTFEIVAGKALSAPAGTAVIDGEHVDLDALDVRVKSLVSTLQHYKDNMPFTTSLTAPPLTFREEREIIDRNRAKTAAVEASRVDGVRNAGETVDVPASALLGPHRRDRTGAIIDDGVWGLDDLRPVGEIPNTIPGDVLGNLLRGDLPEAPREMTPEEALAALAIDANDAKREVEARESSEALARRIAAVKARVDGEKPETDRKRRFRLPEITR
jgi:phage head maturation protease